MSKEYYPVDHAKFSADVSPVEAYSLENLTSDVVDPVWPSESVEYGHDRTQPAGSVLNSVRTNSGFLDLLHHVKEEIDEWIERESDGEGHKWPGPQDKPMIVQTWSRGSRYMRANTFNIGTSSGGLMLVQERSPRGSVVVTNYSAAIVYFSHLAIGWDAGSPAKNPPNVGQIAVNGTRTFPTEAAIWFYPAVSGTAQLLDVVEFYGTPNNEPYS